MPFTDLFPWLSRDTATNGHEIQPLHAIAGGPEEAFDGMAAVEHAYEAIEQLYHMVLLLLESQAPSAQHEHYRRHATVALTGIVAVRAGWQGEE